VRSDATGHRRVLRWYPASWRERYGDELIDLLDDTYGDTPLPVRARWAIVCAGLNERCRDAGVVGATPPRDDRVRGGALIILVAWSLFVVAGSGFAKYSEHWSAVTPHADQLVPTVAFDIVQGAAYVATATCVVAAFISWPSFWRFARREGIGPVLRRVRPAVVAVVVSVLSTAVIVVVAHHLGATNRNAAGPYGVFALSWAALLVLCLGTVVVTIGRVVLRLDYSTRQRRYVSMAASMAMLAMVAIFVSTLVWWIAIAQHASWFFASGVVGRPGISAPMAMVVCASIMLVGVVIAIWGVRRLSLGALGDLLTS